MSDLTAKNESLQNFEKTIKLLVSALDAETEADYGAIISSLQKIKGIDNPEFFSLFINFKLDEIQKVTLQKMLNTRNSVECFIYMNWDFLKRHLANFFQRTEGFACSVDKARWVITQYLKKQRKEEYKKIPEEKQYWHPKIGTIEDYFKFCDAIHMLYWGQPEIYIQKYAELLKRSKENV